MPLSVEQFIRSDDPLSEDALRFLLEYQEEDNMVDYKFTFDDEEQKWLELTKDVLALANTHGGYLVFGIRDGTFEKVGLSGQALMLIKDINQIMQKVNRFVTPDIHSLRCKPIEIENKTFVIVFIPPSLSKTHIISRDGSFIYPSKTEKLVLRKGTTYVRRSAGNHLMDDRDLDDIVNRRLDHFKSTLLDRISRVVEAPSDSDVYILSQDKSVSNETRYIIQDAPESSEIKGKSFSLVPETIEQEISGWVGMTSHEPEAIPSSAITWKWYANRKSIVLTQDQRLWVAKYCLLTGVPAFFWLKGIEAKDIKIILMDLITRNAKIDCISDVVSTGAFLGDRFHRSLISEIGDIAKRLAPTKMTIPSSGPKTFFSANSLSPRGKGVMSLEEELDTIASSAQNERNHEPPLQQRWRAQSLDCHLYAQEDQYIKDASKSRKK